MHLISATLISGDAPLSVQFEDESTGKITSNAWDFDNDGTIDSTAQSPAYVYSTAGTYAVNLTVTGPGGSGNEPQLSSVTVSEPLAKPVANFTADPKQGVAPLNVQFTDISTGTAITACAWDFENDGTVDRTEPGPGILSRCRSGVPTSLRTARSPAPGTSVTARARPKRIRRTSTQTPVSYFARLDVTNHAGSDQDFRFIFVLPRWSSLWATGNK